ncbi:hypothetical protein CEP54_000119 [Fusarium duplospermum]|uniref:Clr5 domain-containing protein n=1 Tax=Fusarium duplospermum TaxID=1325734 RepID=A0A428R8D2_9HYPO|nr:hypothetical protein CEP54_000119 [Fusarium duplospermum]
MAIDWKPYERHVNRWYLDEGKTANEVIRLLLENHGLEVTERQFKAKFGGCKKISSKEWSILIPKIREREANGLKSVIYVCGKAVKQESMTRSIRRYSKLCRDGSQSGTAIDLGIDTIGQHRIEIRAPSETGTQLPGDLSTAEVQPTNGGENSLNLQNDGLDVDEEFGPAEMDLEPGVSAPAGNAICPSPSMFLGILDQLPSNLLETLPFSDTHGMQMESDGTALSSSQWLSLPPSIDLATLFPSQHTFKSFWDSPDISGLTLKGCEAAVNVAKRIGIFVPDYSRHKFLPKLDISPAQTGVLDPILQSIEEVLTHPESKIPGASRTMRNEAKLNFSPTLLDVVQGDSLAQALSVIVYMVSNNLLDEKENLRLICWILKRGHVPNLLTFSRLPAVQHLAFGPAFLRAIAKTADSLRPHNAESIGLIEDFVSSRKFLSLVKSHHEHISGPLGTMLFRLAIMTDSMELAKLLGSHGVDLRSDSVCPRDPHLTPVLALAIDRYKHSMLVLIISLGVDVNQSFPGGPALQRAFDRGNRVAAQTLLDAGALIPDQILFSLAFQKDPVLDALLRKSLEHDSRFVCRELVIAAKKGNRELSKVYVPDDIAPSQVLEQAMCRAIESEDLPATRTFLQRRTDPNVGMVAFGNYLSMLDPLGDSCSFLLHGLLNWGQLDCLDLALQAGARTNGKYEGISPIQLAVLKKDSDAIQSLLQHGAKINGCPRSVGGDTMIPEMPLPSPIPFRDIDQYQEPVKHMIFSHVDSSGFVMGVFADKEPYFPHTPLQLASSSKDPDLGIVELLLSQEADINAPAAEWYGRTALQGAISAKKLNMKVVELFLHHGADVNAPPAHVGGVTALQAAAIRGDIQLVRLLLDRRANINAPGSPEEGRTALEGAAEHGRMEMLRFLLSKGAIPDFVTGYSRAIELAEKELHIGVANFLREEQRKLHGMGWGLGPLGLGLDSL